MKIFQTIIMKTLVCNKSFKIKFNLIKKIKKLNLFLTKYTIKFLIIQNNGDSMISMNFIKINKMKKIKIIITINNNKKMYKIVKTVLLNN